MQLWQGGIVATMMDPAAELIVTSDFPMGEHMLPGTTVEKIHEVVEAWGTAVRRAVEAGFDTVEFHAAHNYSPHMFLSPYFNRRTDKYGSSLEKRARYLLEIIQSIRKNIPQDMPVIMRGTPRTTTWSPV